MTSETNLLDIICLDLVVYPPCSILGYIKICCVGYNKIWVKKYVFGLLNYCHCDLIFHWKNKLKIK